MRIFTDFETVSASSAELDDELARVSNNLASVHSIIAIASAKGGAGKSVLAVNLAAAVALKGRKVAILDADFNSPSVVAMLGMKPRRNFPLVEGLEPAAGPHGLRVVAADLLPGGEPPPVSFIGDDAPAPSNHEPPIAMSRAKALRTMLGQARFGATDLLIIDLAPGLGELHALAMTTKPDGVILMSQPSEHAEHAARHAIELAAAISVPIIGIVENMVGYNCDGCRTVRPLLPEGALLGLAGEFELPILARLPFDPRLAESSDRGTLFVREQADSPIAKGIGELAESLERLVPVGPRVLEPRD
jgi:ATP-binding protein involved in chromosome partitioning